MAAKTGTYSKIASTTINTNTTITFSSIPQTYTDLVAVFKGGIVTDYWSFICRINSDTGSNYSTIYMYGDGSSSGGGQYTNETIARIGGLGSGLRSNVLNSTAIVNFQDYSNTTTYKTIIDKSGDAGSGTSFGVSVWRSTSAINSIEFMSNASGGTLTNLYSGSTITLYGIESGNL